MQVAVVKPITTHHHRVFKDTPDPPVLYFNTLLTAFSEIEKTIHYLMLKYKIIRFGYYEGCSEINLYFGTRWLWVEIEIWALNGTNIISEQSEDLRLKMTVQASSVHKERNRGLTMLMIALVKQLLDKFELPNRFGVGVNFYVQIFRMELFDWRHLPFLSSLWKLVSHLWSFYTTKKVHLHSNIFFCKQHRFHNEHHASCTK